MRKFYVGIGDKFLVTVSDPPNGDCINSCASIEDARHRANNLAQQYLTVPVVVYQRIETHRAKVSDVQIEPEPIDG